MATKAKRETGIVNRNRKKEMRNRFIPSLKGGGGLLNEDRPLGIINNGKKYIGSIGK
jgi:hypothetical protein